MDLEILLPVPQDFLCILCIHWELGENGRFWFGNGIANSNLSAVVNWSVLKHSFLNTWEGQKPEGPINAIKQALPTPPHPVFQLFQRFQYHPTLTSWKEVPPSGTPES